VIQKRKTFSTFERVSRVEIAGKHFVAVVLFARRNLIKVFRETRNGDGVKERRDNYEIANPFFCLFSF
jgi:hypothetical protein